MAETSSKEPNRNQNSKLENNKSAHYKAPESSDHDAIRGQVEFYFSNGNLPYDTFLLKQTGGVENKAVPISTIHAFKRMKHFQPYAAVVEALQASQELQVRGEPGEETVGRETPIAAHYTLDGAANRKLDNEEMDARTVYAKGFGAEEVDTQVKIEELFSSFSPSAVRLRRTPFAVFKGSAYIEFPTPQGAREFMFGPGGDEEAFKSNKETAPRNSVKYNDKDLHFLFKAEHDKEKAAQAEHYKNANPRHNNKRNDNSRRGRGSRQAPRGGRGGRGGRNGNNNRRDQDRDRSRSPRRETDEDGKKNASRRSRSPIQDRPASASRDGQAEGKGESKEEGKEKSNGEDKGEVHGGGEVKAQANGQQNDQGDA